MKIDRVLRYTALLLIFSTFGQSLAFARKPLDGVVVRDKLAAIGEGQQCRVKLVDGTQAEGIIVSIHADDFTLKTKNVDESRQIEYAQITGVRKTGRLKDNKVPIIVGAITVGTLVGIVWWVMYEMTHSGGI
jgi:hypothetical protein